MSSSYGFDLDKIHEALAGIKARFADQPQILKAADGVEDCIVEGRLQPGIAGRAQKLVAEIDLLDDSK